MAPNRLICVCCACGMENIMSGRGHQPSGGMSFHSYGHYGTSFFDPMDGSYVQVAICDECLVSADSRGAITRRPPSKDNDRQRTIEEGQKFILESDLDSAVEVAWKRGASDWVRLNYPKHYERSPVEKIDSDELMRRFSQVALEKAMQFLSESARLAAEACPEDMSGKDALMAFSLAILSTNAKVWSAEGRG